MIRAIVFDLGGVLIDLDFDNCVRSFREILGYERITEILDLSHQKGIYGDMEAGLITADEFRAAVLADSRPGCVPADVDRAMAGLLTGMDPAKVPLLERLAEKYPVYGLSNNNEISTARMHEIYEESRLDWRRVFRKEFLSCRMKMMKPAREIFDAVAAEIGFPPAEILFVDDSQKNVDGARASQIICNFGTCRCTVTSGSASLPRRRCPPTRWMRNTSGSEPARSGASPRPTSSTMCAG